LILSDLDQVCDMYETLYLVELIKICMVLVWCG